MKCPYCSGEESKVVDSRATEDDGAIRRRRECLGCNRRYTTYEKIEDIPVFVIKRNLAREIFSRDKIINGVIRACEKRPVSRADIDHLVNDIEKTLNNTMTSEVSSETIGEMILDKLRSMDEVAYIRFASVYRKFDDINSFIEEIQRLSGGK
ncbi:MAG: transcriptional regulator NrdR [Clostridium sp.]|uniref:transcriptional regulator NrdR n=1 Tax=Clostridium culturomicium TaxID=1499683 RepID=UPI00058FBE85|nr:transcriptional regulator NrdR [Clostridium culturomicium]MDU4889113.1 transcriptional regulator NrdR [Clostridium sp.]MDU7083243.1 transcriptional regulator NrdR [Clostridium sp.]